jgi:uncharacterized membrane protein required for colicin V production
MAVVSYSGLFGWQRGFFGQATIVMTQFIGFYLAAEWALDGLEW